MATVKMKRLKIVAPKNEQQSILQLLTQSGCFEMSKAEDIDEFDELAIAIIDTDQLKQKQIKIANAIETLTSLIVEANETNKDNQQEIFEIDEQSVNTIKFELSFDEYNNYLKNEAILLGLCDQIEDIKQDKYDLSTKIDDLTTLNKELEKYTGINLPFSRFKDTQTTGVILVTKEGGVADKEELKKFDCYIESYPTDLVAVWGILCKLEKKSSLLRKLNSLNFVPCAFEYDATATNLISENLTCIEQAKIHLTQKIHDGLNFQTHLKSLKTLFDVYSLEIEKATADTNIYKDDDLITIEGWTPQTAAPQIEARLKNQIPCADIESRTPKFGDSPPSLSINSKLARPFESVAKGYGSPTYGELDPTPVMSIFFFIFFGIMLADAGYGLIMALGGLLLGLFSKKFAPMKRMIIMFAICGISGILWGLVFGGIFGIEIFDSYGQPWALWFNPMHDPVTMLILSIALGIVHLLAGFTLKTIKTIKTDVALTQNKKSGFLKILDGIFDSIFMYLLIFGILFMLLPMLFDGSNFPFNTVAIILLITAIAGILFTGGRRAPGIGGKIAGGLGGLYKLINLFSDVLSYSRLFGLAIASGAIAMAFNQIGAMLFGIPVVGYVLGGIILVVLHAFNFALAALAAYVHDIRLQYVEFFGKFYEGNGRSFEPLGSTARYVNFIDNKELN